MKERQEKLSKHGFTERKLIQKYKNIISDDRLRLFLNEDKYTAKEINKLEKDIIINLIETWREEINRYGFNEKSKKNLQELTKIDNITKFLKDNLEKSGISRIGKATINLSCLTYVDDEYKKLFNYDTDNIIVLPYLQSMYVSRLFARFKTEYSKIDKGYKEDKDFKNIIDNITKWEEAKYKRSPLKCDIIKLTEITDKDKSGCYTVACSKYFNNLPSFMSPKIYTKNIHEAIFLSIYIRLVRPYYILLALRDSKFINNYLYKRLVTNYMNSLFNLLSSIGWLNIIKVKWEEGMSDHINISVNEDYIGYGDKINIDNIKDANRILHNIGIDVLMNIDKHDTY